MCLAKNLSLSLNSHITPRCQQKVSIFRQKCDGGGPYGGGDHGAQKISRIGSHIISKFSQKVKKLRHRKNSFDTRSATSSHLNFFKKSVCKGLFFFGTPCILFTKIGAFQADCRVVFRVFSQNPRVFPNSFCDIRVEEVKMHRLKGYFGIEENRLMQFGHNSTIILFPNFCHLFLLNYGMKH